MRQSLPADRLLHPLGYTTPLGRRDWTVSLGQARRRVGHLDRRQVAELAALVAADRLLAGAGRPLALEALELPAGLEAPEPLEGLAEGAQSHLDGIR